MLVSRCVQVSAIDGEAPAIARTSIETDKYAVWRTLIIRFIALIEADPIICEQPGQRLGRKEIATQKRHEMDTGEAEAVGTYRLKVRR